MSAGLFQVPVDGVAPLLLGLKRLRATVRNDEAAIAPIVHFLSAFISGNVIQLHDKSAVLIVADIGNRQVNGNGQLILFVTLVGDVEASGGVTYGGFEAQIPNIRLWRLVHYDFVNDQGFGFLGGSFGVSGYSRWLGTLLVEISCHGPFVLPQPVDHSSLVLHRQKVGNRAAALNVEEPRRLEWSPLLRFDIAFSVKAEFLLSQDLESELVLFDFEGLCVRLALIVGLFSDPSPGQRLQVIRKQRCSADKRENKCGRPVKNWLFHKT